MLHSRDGPVAVGRFVEHMVVAHPGGRRDHSGAVAGGMAISGADKQITLDGTN
jgi:hypothetical protein